MSSNSTLPSLRPIAGKQRKRSDAEHVDATSAAAQTARQAALEPSKNATTQATIETNAQTAIVQLQSQELQTNHFRFLDLVPELQEIVYSFYAALTANLKGEECLPLSGFRIPALAQVNKKVRHDLLRVFFRETPFYVRVGPGFIPSINQAPLTRINERLYKDIQASKDPLDPVFLRPHVAGAVDEGMVFNDVTFLLHQITSVDGIRTVLWKDRFESKNQQTKGCRLMKLPVQWCDRQVVIGEDSKHPSPYFVERDQIRTGTTKFAKDIAAREEFKGFTLEDLRRIAVMMVAGF